MRSVTVAASSTYDIHIGEGLLSQVGSFITRMNGVEKVCIVSDTKVWPLYGHIVQNAVEKAGATVCSFVFPYGEESKNGATYLALLEHLASNRLTRTDLIVALGGGVVGDLAGFAAATFLRGIRLIQIPTTLLAAVDSSVGGKTAIDLPSGKNLAGAFYQPSFVLCDTTVLNSLPDDIFRDGCAEVIKYAVLYDDELFLHLQEYGLGFDREAVICRCVQLKRDAVVADEFDRGLRKKLNLGHTVGHAVESLSNYSVSHGSAVAIGTAIISRSAFSQGLLSGEQCRQIIQLLQSFGLPTETAFSARALYDAALSDKKRNGSHLDLIVPNRIGDCSIMKTPVCELEDIIQAGL